MIVCLLFSNFWTISIFLVYFLNILWFIHIQLWSIVHYYFTFPTPKKKKIIHGPPKYKFLAPPLILICSMNYTIRISLKFSRNWNLCGDCRWSCFVVDSSKPIWQRERERKKFVQNKKVSLTAVLPYRHPCGIYNSMNKWHLQNDHVCKKLNKKVTN